MRIYNFKISGKLELELEDCKGNNRISAEGDYLPKNNENNVCKIIKEKIIEKFFDKIWEIIGGLIFSLIFILGLLLPEGSFLELLYIFHKRVIYSILFLLIIVEGVYLVKGLIKGKEKDIKELISHTLISLAFFLVLFVLNLGIYEKLVSPKLTTIEVLEPKDRSEVSKPVIEAKIFVRNVEIPIYLIVETPQGTHWIQAKRFIPHKQFKTTLSQEVRLGDGYIGIGESFKIFTIGTKEELEIGVLEKIPPYSIVSNVVAVKRVQ